MAHGLAFCLHAGGLCVAIPLAEQNLGPLTLYHPLAALRLRRLVGLHLFKNKQVSLHDMSDNKNLAIAVVLSAVVLIGWQMLFPPPQPPAPAPSEAVTQLPSTELDNVAPLDTGSALETQAQIRLSREDILKQSERINLRSPLVQGSIAVKGSAIDNIVLTQYRQELDQNSDDIVLLSPKGSELPFFARFGWSLLAGKATLPDSQSIWTKTSTCPDLSPDCPLTLTWSGPDGITVNRTISTDESYMITLEDEIINQSDAVMTLAPYGLLRRVGLPKLENFYIAHEGFIGVSQDTLQEVSYDSVYDDGDQSFTSTGGWVGITDKYFMATLIPDQTVPVRMQMRADRKAAVQTYQAEYTAQEVQLGSGEKAQYKHRLFAGAKVVEFIDGYADAGVSRFDLSIDWGWFFFLTKPMFIVLDFLNKLVGNFGVAIILLTVLVKIIFFPLANTSYKAMSRMKALTPEMMKIRERYKDDKQKLQQETMELYKREKVNPVSGCLPMLIQIPVFFALYKVLFTTIEMRHAPFFGWIEDLSAPDPTSLFNLFGLLPYDVPGFLMIGIWPVLMGMTMYVQQKLNPPPTDPTQAQIFAFLPVVFTFMLGTFAAGLVIYWTFNNLLSILQQALIMKRMGVPIELYIGNKAKKPNS